MPAAAAANPQRCDDGLDLPAAPTNPVYSSTGADLSHQKQEPSKQSLPEGYWAERLTSHVQEGSILSYVN